jgi:nucleotide-binding universal stress UspA family protein
MRIMVATDGSRGSTAALNFAARLASEERGSELVVLTVASSNGSDPRSVAQKILDKAARDMKAQGASASFQVVTARRRDEVPEAISREADRLKADLVVVGSEGRDTLSEWVLGGTALRLIYVARRPVTVVRPPRRRKAS